MDGAMRAGEDLSGLLLLILAGSIRAGRYSIWPLSAGTSKLLDCRHTIFFRPRGEGGEKKKKNAHYI